MYRYLTVLLALFTVLSVTRADDLGVELAEGTTVFPAADWKESVDPIASPDAVPGGSITMFIGPNPKSFNYYLENSVMAAMVFSMMYETMLDSNSVTLEDEPGLASRWAISPDKKTFTFWMNPKAKWSDGKPVTAHDVKYTYDAVIKSPLTGPHKVDLERFEAVTVLNDRCIQFTASEVHWKNLLAAGGMTILPAHYWKTRKFDEISFEFGVTSGLYKIKEFKENISVVLEKRRDYWNIKSPRLEGKYNFQNIVFRFYNERQNAFDAFVDGEMDLFPVYTAHRWAQEAQGEKYERNWTVRQKVYNYNPIGFQGFAMNSRRFPFDDRNVRLAMAHLLDRERLNKDLMHNQYFLHQSYFEDLYGTNQPCPNEPIVFDKDKARQLLKDAGWVPNPETGLLEKNGKPFAFTFLTRSSSSERFLAIYREALKDVGIEIKTEQKDWAAWASDMDNFNFDMTWAAWGAGVRKDPEGMWSSKEAVRKSGNNITGFKNAEVDRLIESQRTNFNIEERHEIVRKIDQLVYKDVPYVLLWNLNFTRLLYWNRFGMPYTVLSKFGDESSALAYWWVDEDAEASLAKAMKAEKALPKRLEEINFDEEFDE